MYPGTHQVLLSHWQLFKQHQAQLAQQLVLATLVDHNSETRRKIRGLQRNFCAFVVQLPQDGRHDLRQVRLDTYTKGIYDGVESVLHNLVLRRLFLKRIDDPIDQPNLELFVNGVQCAKRCDGLRDRLHHHTAQQLPRGQPGPVRSATVHGLVASVDGMQLPRTRTRSVGGTAQQRRRRAAL